MEQDNLTSRSELDDFAVQMESALERFIGNPDAPQCFVRVGFATDASVGNYPQAARDQRHAYRNDDGSPHQDRFPLDVREPLQLKLRPAAKWTDVLSSDLPSEGFLISAQALAIFGRFPLGNAWQFQAEVKKGREQRAYTYLYFANHLTHEDVDFTRSEFYIANMLGDPQRLIEIVSAEDFDRKRRLINQGELEGCKRFSGLRFKSMHLKPQRAPEAAFFGWGPFSPTEMYVRRELYKALRDAGVTGLEFKRNNKIYVD